MNDRLVWIDCEMTGLDLAADALIEVAALVTDFDLNVLGDGIDLVIKPPAEALEQMDAYVRDDARDAPGCWTSSTPGSPSRDAEAQVLAYISSTAPTAAGRRWPATPSPPTGSFLARDMPTLEAFLHYRIVDVSSIKELSRRWFPRAYFHAPAKRGNHRALADIQESIEELRYYREAVFVPPPGPDSDTAKGLAAKHGGALTGLGLTAAADDDSRFGGRGRSPSRLLSGPGRRRRGRMVGIAQLVERRVVVADVAGSSPVTHPSTSTAPPVRSGGAASSRGDASGLVATVVPDRRAP